jgi:hypothetical protein
MQLFGDEEEDAFIKRLLALRVVEPHASLHRGHQVER